VKKAKTVLLTRKYSKKVHKELLLKMFLANNIPFNFVENVKFCNHVQFLHPKADLPNR
jgi:hypothetical protein